MRRFSDKEIPAHDMARATPSPEHFNALAIENGPADSYGCIVCMH